MDVDVVVERVARQMADITGVESAAPEQLSTLRMLIGMAVTTGRHIEVFLADPDGPDRAMNALVRIWKLSLELG
ncbi:hypothetical protein [Nocardia sp. NPDC056100]|uniref:hypothetical protein n=1 Tax=Nocardia sp. NPDC056100 TaxID=3345712 RepID=UPI0035E027B1